ncbi:NAD(P)H-binding protein [Neisseria yangbaofengii]|uniref:NAD(P)H-binding protein n=1 Tax=Neisseria yangbaofengii TaxID=2709396 RepID=UPI0013EAB227|nr:NAD(P)H-binding protein [Neisseria yangbaofengii]
MKALIIGATGATGKPLTRQLLQHPDIDQVTVFVRKPPDFTHPKLTVEIIDFDKPRTWQDKVTGDVLFSCLGTTIKQAGSQEKQYQIDFTYQYQFAQAAKRNGVAHYVLVSAGMANPESKSFYMRMKGELEQAINTLNFEHASILRPPLLKRLNSGRTGEVWAEKALEFLNSFGLLSAQKPLPTSQLATAMIKSFTLKRSGILEKEDIWALLDA